MGLSTQLPRFPGKLTTKSAAEGGCLKGNSRTKRRLSTTPSRMASSMCEAGSSVSGRSRPPSPNASGCSRQISTRLWMCAHLVVCGRQCCFQRRSCKRSLRPTLRYARSWRSNESGCGRSGRRSKGQHEKRGGLWGRKPPRRRHDSSCCRNLSPRCQQQMHSNPSQLRSAISVNPQAEAIFWTTVANDPF